MAVIARMLLDASDPYDVAAVSTLQDGFALSAVSAEPFVLRSYDQDSYKRTFDALIELGQGQLETRRR